MSAAAAVGAAAPPALRPFRLAPAVPAKQAGKVTRVHAPCRQSEFCLVTAPFVAACVQAVSKFKQAIVIDSKRHDTKWCLGNAYTSQVLKP